MANKTHRFAGCSLLLLFTVLAGATAPLAGERRFSRVDAFTTDTWTRSVGPGWREIVVDGDRDTDLDLFVYDAAGRLLASDDDSTDYCVARWYQLRRGVVRIVIRNLGSIYNEYEMTIE